MFVHVNRGKGAGKLTSKLQRLPAVTSTVLQFRNVLSLKQVLFCRIKCRDTNFVFKK